ncbi:MAG: flagellar basal body rod protein FlgB [Candidatus Eisenbacteria bacterium]
MSTFGLFSRTTLPVLKRVMDFAALRQRVYAGNVANAEVPGYRRRDVEFAEEMARVRGNALAPATTDARHIGETEKSERFFEIVEDRGPDGENGVDLEIELVALAENQLRFNIAARLAAMRVAGIRASIRGRT